jgi:inorganic pyrophosphatase
MGAAMPTDSMSYIGHEVDVVMDRPLGSRHPGHGFVYLVNYGYVPGTLSADGEELDVYVLGVDEPVQTFHGVCIAVIQRLDDADDKLVVAPCGCAMDDATIAEKTEFVERYFSSRIVR